MLRSYYSSQSPIPTGHRWSIVEAANAATSYQEYPAIVGQLRHEFVDASSSGGSNPCIRGCREVRDIGRQGEDLEWKARLRRGIFVISIGTGVRSILKPGLPEDVLRHYKNIAQDAERVHDDLFHYLTER